MHALASTLLTLGLQLALGALVSVAAVAFFPRGLRGLGSARRRHAAVRARGAATILRALPLAVALGLAGAGLLVGLGAEPQSLLASPGPWALVVLGVVPTSGGYLLHDSARQEAAGRLRRARRQVGLGGRLTFWGILVMLAWVGAEVLWRADLGAAIPAESPFAAPLLGIGVLALVAAAVTALLAGLTHKPRPSAEYAVLLYLGGLAAVLGAAGLMGWA